VDRTDYVKQLFDDTLTAWDADDGSNELRSRDGAPQAGRADVNAVEELLKEPSRAVLGRRQLLSPWGRSPNRAEGN
jgi:hypothetical protein